MIGKRIYFADEVLCDGETIDVEFTVTEDTLDWDFCYRGYRMGIS